jgi:hypothetical protein
MAPDIESLVIERLGYKIAVTHEKAFPARRRRREAAGPDGGQQRRDPDQPGRVDRQHGHRDQPDNLIRVKQSLKQQ